MVLDFVLRLIVTIYDVITLPAYIAVQKPWIRVRRQAITWAGPMSNKSDSPLIRYTPDPMKALFKGLDTVDAFFKRAVEKFDTKPCFGTRVCKKEDHQRVDGKRIVKYELGEYRWKSFREADAVVDKIARGLTGLGHLPQTRLVIFAETREEWMLTALACFRRAIIVCTIYATLGDEGIVHGINETEVKTLITSEELLKRLAVLAPRLPNLTQIVYMPARGGTKPQPPMGSIALIPFESLLDSKLSGDMPPVTVTPQDVVIIMYTSGSTGQPKGVILTNANVVAFMVGAASILREFSSGDTFIGFLPLAHVMEIAVELTFMSLGVRIGYASPLTLTDQGTALMPGVPGDAPLLKPTAMIAVPLLLNRIRKGVEQAVAAKGPFTRALFAFGMTYKSYWKKKGFTTPILNRVVFRSTKKILGGRLKAIVSGSAPLSEDTQEFLSNCLDCPVIQGYGLTETTAGATIQDKYDLDVGVVGPPLNGTQIKLIDWEEGGYHVTDRPHPRGEVVIGGPTVAAGYFKRPELTEECFKDDGKVRWFLTGDIAELLPRGQIRIVDRKKDLVKLQYGEYVSLGKVETVLKTHPLVENVCVYGSSLSTFTVALIQPSESALWEFAKSVPVPYYKSLASLCDDPVLNTAVTSELTKHCRKSGLVKFEIPLKYKLCKEAWTPDIELVTAALKIRRIQLQKFYKKDIDSMYQGVSNTGSSSDLQSPKSQDEGLCSGPGSPKTIPALAEKPKWQVQLQLQGHSQIQPQTQEQTQLQSQLKAEVHPERQPQEQSHEQSQSQGQPEVHPEVQPQTQPKPQEQPQEPSQAQQQAHPREQSQEQPEVLPQTQTKPQEQPHVLSQAQQQGQSHEQSHLQVQPEVQPQAQPKPQEQLQEQRQEQTLGQAHLQAQQEVQAQTQPKPQEQPQEQSQTQGQVHMQDQSLEQSQVKPEAQQAVQPQDQSQEQSHPAASEK